MALFSPDLAIMHYYWIVLWLIAVCLMNIQVSTRFMSTFPLFYWHVGFHCFSCTNNKIIENKNIKNIKIIKDNKFTQNGEKLMLKNFLKWWFFLYFLAGCITFPLFIAWV